MGIIAWILLGLISGFIASRLSQGTGMGIVLDIVLGIVGAVVGGLIFHLVGVRGVTGLNLWSLLVAVIGSWIVLAIFHALSGPRWRRVT